MTEEQYKEVISLDKRLKELKEVYSILDQKSTHLGYYKEGCMDHSNELRSTKDFTSIKDILTKYENIIRLEVKGEMESIKKQISEL